MYSELTEQEERTLIEKFAKYVVDRRLEKPAILFLEGWKPISFVGSQFALMTIGPFLGMTDFSGEWGPKVILLFEKRTNVEFLLRRIDELVDQRDNKVENASARTEKQKAADQTTDKGKLTRLRKILGLS